MPEMWTDHAIAAQLYDIPVCRAHFVRKVAGLLTDYLTVRHTESGEQCEACRVEELP